MRDPSESYLKDLLEDMEYAIEEEDCVINVTSKDVEKVQMAINRSRRLESILERERDVRQLFERKFIAYRNKMVDIYQDLSDDEPLKQTIRTFLEEGQKDVIFNPQ